MPNTFHLYKVENYSIACKESLTQQKRDKINLYAAF